MELQEIKKIVSDIFSEKVNESDPQERVGYIIEKLDRLFRNQQEIYDENAFFEEVNQNYQAFSEEEKERFLNSLPITGGVFSTRYFSYDDSRFLNRFLLFRNLEDENKYLSVSANIMAGLLERGLYETEYERVDILAKLYQINPNDFYWKKYVELCQKNNEMKINLTGEELIQILDDNQIQSEGFRRKALLSIDETNLKGYFISNYHEDLSLFGYFSHKQGKAILEGITEQRERAYILLNTPCIVDDMAFFTDAIEDDFVCHILTLSKDNRIVNKMKQGTVTLDNLMSLIDYYYDFKQQLLEQPIEGRGQFLIDHLNENGNLMSVYLLDFIDDAEDRKVVLDSMQTEVMDEELEDYVKLTQKMMMDYFKEKSNLSPEQEEKMQRVFKMFKVGFISFDDDKTNGECWYTGKQISLSEKNQGDIPNLMIDLLHEWAHAFSHYDYSRTIYNCQAVFEEGMADTMAELVANWYFQNYHVVELNGEEFSPTYSLVSSSTYYDANSWVKTMLYPLEESGQDIEAMKEYLLGDKKRFFDLCLQDGFSNIVKKDQHGNLIDIDITNDDLVECHKEAYAHLNHGSLYRVKNNRIMKLSREAKKMMEQENERNTEKTSPFEEVTKAVKENGIRFGEVAAVKFQFEKDEMADENSASKSQSKKDERADENGEIN